MEQRIRAAAVPAAPRCSTPGWCRPAGFGALLAAYAVVHVALRVWLSPTLTIDDSREAMLAQTLAWGYQARQPPLYNWLVWAAFRSVGAGVLGLTLVKYAVLAVAYAFVYASGRRILGEGRLPALAALSLLLMVPITWVVHEALTHSVAVLAAAAAAFYTLLRVEASGSRSAYVAFGAALAAGLLSKFSFALFAGALLVGALGVDRFRARLLHRRMLLAVATAALVVLPFAVWFYRHDFALMRIYAEEVDPGEPEPWLRGVASALYYMVRVSLYYLTPAWLILLALFPGAWRPAGSDAAPPSPGERLLARFFLAELGILLAGTLFAGLTYLKFRWLMPALFLFPLYIFCRVARRPIDGARLRGYGRVLLAAEAIVLLAFVGNIARGDALGKASHLNAPYDTLAARLAAAGFTHGTLAGGEGPVAGNLRLWFPRARVVRIANPDYLPPGDGGGQCLIVWEKERSDPVPVEVREWLAAALGATVPPEAPGRVLEALYHHATGQVLRVRYLLLPQGTGRCR
jgi:lipopolysaccharide core galacturonosyltransferase RgtB